MKFIIYSLILFQTLLLLSLLIKLKKKNHFFTLPSVFGVSCFFYITFPTAVYVSIPYTIFNGVKIAIFLEPLLISSFVGLLLISLFYFIPTTNFSREQEDAKWAELLFFILGILNLYYFFKFIYCLDFNLVFSMLETRNSSAIRGLSYLTLEGLHISLGYVLATLQIALFGFLWVENKLNKKFLLLAISPVLFMNLFSLSRIGLASFFVTLLFCVEHDKKIVRIYSYAFVLIILLFLLRPLFYSLTFDTSYNEWFQMSLSKIENFQELFGEFFNTFSSYIMVWGVEQAKFSSNEILTMLLSQVFIPPGFTNSFYSLIGETYPIFRLSELILKLYGIHPAHSSLVDIYTFGYFSILGFLFLGLIIYKVSKKPTGINKLVYLYLLSVFYLPFRGSLTLSVIRIFWLMAGLIVFRYFVKRTHLFLKLRSKI